MWYRVCAKLKYYKTTGNIFHMLLCVEEWFVIPRIHARMCRCDVIKFDFCAHASMHDAVQTYTAADGRLRSVTVVAPRLTLKVLVTTIDGLRHF